MECAVKNSLHKLMKNVTCIVQMLTGNRTLRGIRADIIHRYTYQKLHLKLIFDKAINSIAFHDSEKPS